MAIIRNDSQQTMANISVTREDGQRVQVVSASCHIRPEKGLSINVDTLDATAITDANRSEVGEAVVQFIIEQLSRATEQGVPVALMAGK